VHKTSSIKRLRFLRAFYVYANFEQVTAYFYVANSCFKYALFFFLDVCRVDMMVTVLNTLFRLVCSSKLLKLLSIVGSISQF
jgi:hypothetical protein